MCSQCVTVLDNTPGDEASNECIQHVSWYVHTLQHDYFFSPDIQVGMPLSALVDKVLESKAKELLPKISEVVDKLRENKARGSPSTPGLSSSFGTSEITITDEPSKAKPTDFGSLPLPIDIPGLTLSTSGSSASPSTRKDPTEGKVALKSKSKATDASSKENKMKGKSVQPKVPTAAKESLSLKREKEVNSEKDMTTEEGGKEKDQLTSTSKLKKNKADVKDKGTNVYKEKSQVGFAEKADDVKDKGASVNKNKANDSEKPEDTRDKGAGVQREKHQDAKPCNHEKPDQVSHAGNPDIKVKKPTNDSKKDTSAELGGSKVSSDSKKTLPPRRKSARIASLSEDNGKEEGDSDDHKMAGEKPSKREMMDDRNQMKEETVDTKSSGCITKRKRKQKALKIEGQKKRQRLLSSSTDEELEIHVSSEEEFDYLNSEKCASESKSNLRDSQSQDASAQKKAKKRAPVGDLSVSVPQRKSRKLNKGFNDAIKPVDNPAHPPQMVEKIQKPHRRKSSQPQRLPVRSSKSPPAPVVVTRYNRQIKPNRRYIDTSGEASDEAEGNERADVAGEEKQTLRDSEEAYSDIDSNSECDTS